MTQNTQIAAFPQALTLPVDIQERIQKVCDQPDRRRWEQVEEPRKTPEYRRGSILASLEQMGVDPKDHSRALGHILYETDPGVLAAIDNQLSEVVKGFPGVSGTIPAHEGMEKLTWSVAALTLPHSHLLRVTAFETAFGQDSTRVLEKGAKPCGGLSIPGLEGLSESYLVGRGGTSSPTTTHVFQHVSPDVKSKRTDFEAKPGVDKLMEQSDPELARSLLALNRDLRDTYLKRKFRGDPDCHEGVAVNTKLCMSQFAVASGGIARDSDIGEPLKVTHTPQSRLIQMVKFGQVDGLPIDDRDLAQEILELSFGETQQGPDEKNGRPLVSGQTVPDGSERFTYPAAPSGPR